MDRKTTEQTRWKHNAPTAGYGVFSLWEHKKVIGCRRRRRRPPPPPPPLLLPLLLLLLLLPHAHSKGDQMTPPITDRSTFCRLSEVANKLVHHLSCIVKLSPLDDDPEKGPNWEKLFPIISRMATGPSVSVEWINYVWSSRITSHPQSFCETLRDCWSGTCSLNSASNAQPTLSLNDYADK